MTSHGTVNICFGEDYHEIMVRRLLIPTHAFWTSFTGIIDHFLIHKSHWITYGHMMTSSNGNIFRVTGPLWGEFTGHKQINWSSLQSHHQPPSLIYHQILLWNMSWYITFPSFDRWPTIADSHVLSWVSLCLIITPPCVWCALVSHANRECQIHNT